MEEFTVYIENKPGSLARVSEVLSRNGVNIEAIATEGTKKDGTIKIITNDSNSTREALEKSRIHFTVKEVLSANVINRPGELAKLTRKIANERINVESIYIIGNGKFAIRADDMEKAKGILRENKKRGTT